MFLSDDGILHILASDHSCESQVALADTSMVDLMLHDLSPLASSGAEVLVSTADGSLVCLGSGQPTPPEELAEEASKIFMQRLAMPGWVNNRRLSLEKVRVTLASMLVLSQEKKRVTKDSIIALSLDKVRVTIESMFVVSLEKAAVPPGVYVCSHYLRLQEMRVILGVHFCFQSGEVEGHTKIHVCAQPGEGENHNRVHVWAQLGEVERYKESIFVLSLEKVRGTKSSFFFLSLEKLRITLRVHVCSHKGRHKVS